jgi:hypothetical protein
MSVEFTHNIKKKGATDPGTLMEMSKYFVEMDPEREIQAIIDKHFKGQLILTGLLIPHTYDDFPRFDRNWSTYEFTLTPTRLIPDNCYAPVKGGMVNFYYNRRPIHNIMRRRWIILECRLAMRFTYIGPIFCSPYFTVEELEIVDSELIHDVIFPESYNKPRPENYITKDELIAKYGAENIL